MRLTHVDTVVEGADAFFPEFDAGAWRVVSLERHAADARHAFDFEFVDYLRYPLPTLRGRAPAPPPVRRCPAAGRGACRPRPRRCPWHDRHARCTRPAITSAR